MRKNQATLTAAEKTAFVNAVLSLKQEPSILHPDDRTFSRYDDFVEVHLNAMMVMMNNQPSWAHQGPVFCPWHRVLLGNSSWSSNRSMPKSKFLTGIGHDATPGPAPRHSGETIFWDRTGARPLRKSGKL